MFRLKEFDVQFHRVLHHTASIAAFLRTRRMVMRSRESMLGYSDLEMDDIISLYDCLTHEKFKYRQIKRRPFLKICPSKLVKMLKLTD